MKFKGEPNLLVRITKINKHLIRKVPKSVRFDKDGIYETDNPYLIKRLSTRFEQKQEIKVDYSKIDYKELQALYKEKMNKSPVGVSKKEIIKKLEG